MAALHGGPLYNSESANVCLSSAKGKKPLCISKYKLHREWVQPRACKTWVMGVQSYGEHRGTPSRARTFSILSLQRTAYACVEQGRYFLQTTKLYFLSRARCLQLKLAVLSMRLDGKTECGTASVTWFARGRIKAIDPKVGTFQ